MKTKTLGWMAVLGATACAFASCSQAKVECQVLLAGAGYSYATAYVLKSAPSAECLPLVQKGDLIGMEFYNPPSADGTTYDTTKISLAMQSDTLGNELAARGPASNAAGKPWSLGPFTSHLPDANTAFCSVPTLGTAEQDFADIPAMAGMGGAGGAGGGAGTPATPEVPADNVKYQWSNVQIYTTAAAQGTQFTADLTYSEKITKGDGTVVADCTLQYTAIGMGPGIACSGTDAAGNEIPDITLCSPCTDPDAGRTIASGINPNFPTACVQLLNSPDAYGRPAFYCVLKDTTASAKIPQLGDAPSCPADVVQ